MDTKLNTSQQCSLVAKKSNNIWSFVRQSIASGLGKVILPVHSVLCSEVASGVLCCLLGSTAQVDYSVCLACSFFFLFGLLLLFSCFLTLLRTPSQKSVLYLNYNFLKGSCTVIVFISMFSFHLFLHNY